MDRWLIVPVLLAVGVMWWLLQARPAIEQRVEPPTRAWKATETPDDWGALVDPDKKCNLTWKGRGLSFDLPGDVLELQSSGLRNAPRVLKKFNGDFVVEARLSGSWNPKTTRLATNLPYHGAGLLVWIDDQSFIRLERAAIRTPDGRTITYANFEQHLPGGARPIASVQIADDAFPKLAVERQGSAFIGYVDGTRIGFVMLDAPDQIQAGVAAVINTNEPFQFEVKDVQFMKN